MDVDMKSDDENFDDSYDASVFPDLLPAYYKRLFPFSLYYKWLRYDNGVILSSFIILRVLLQLM